VVATIPLVTAWQVYLPAVLKESVCAVDPFRWRPDRPRWYHPGPRWQHRCGLLVRQQHSPLHRQWHHAGRGDRGPGHRPGATRPGRHAHVHRPEQRERPGRLLAGGRVRTRLAGGSPGRGVRRAGGVRAGAPGAGGGDGSHRDSCGGNGYPDADGHLAAVLQRICLSPGYDGRQLWSLPASHSHKVTVQHRAKKPGFFAKGTTLAYEKPSQRSTFRLRDA
jgi:hypothetical protein